MLTIRGWDETFENSKTRKLVQPRWFNCPAGVSSSGYLELMNHGQAGVLALGVFQAICQWSATCPQKNRGKLVRSDGRPMSSRQLATVLRIDVATIEAALKLLESPEIGWIVRDTTKNTDNSEICHTPATDPPSPATCLPKSSPGEERRGEDGIGEDRSGGERITNVAVAPACPAQEIMSEFDAAFGTRSIMTAKRKTALSARWRDPWWRDNWREALARGSPSTFLRGANDRSWVIDFEFFLKPDSVAKILEGKYDNRTHSRNQSRAESREQRNADSFAIIEQAAAAGGG